MKNDDNDRLSAKVVSLWHAFCLKKLHNNQMKD
jgi:glutamate 5-kinase